MPVAKHGDVGFSQGTGLNTPAMENVREFNYRLTAYPLITEVAMQYTHI